MQDTWTEYHEARNKPRFPWPGRLWVHEGFESPQLDNQRDLLVWTPPQAQEESGPFPVLFLHDGQNLFDAETSFAGDWNAAEALGDLAEQGYPVIAIGVPNLAKERIAEYSPFRDERWGGGRGEAYLDFLADTVRPFVGQSFPITEDPAQTGLLGSSLGGLISLYGIFHRPDAFGLCGALSPSIHFAHRAMLDHLRRRSRSETAPNGRRIYLDVGTRERLPPDTPNQLFHHGSWKYRRDVSRTAALLRRRGFRAGQHLLYVEEEDGRHHEEAWRRRFPEALAFLFKPESRA